MLIEPQQGKWWAGPCWMSECMDFCRGQPFIMRLPEWGDVLWNSDSRHPGRRDADGISPSVPLTGVGSSPTEERSQGRINRLTFKSNPLGCGGPLICLGGQVTNLSRTREGGPRPPVSPERWPLSGIFLLDRFLSSRYGPSRPGGYSRARRKCLFADDTQTDRFSWTSDSYFKINLIIWLCQDLVAARWPSVEACGI